jgi:hypothetical protein
MSSLNRNVRNGGICIYLGKEFTLNYESGEVGKIYRLLIQIFINSKDIKIEHVMSQEQYNEFLLWFNYLTDSELKAYISLYKLSK